MELTVYRPKDLGRKLLMMRTNAGITQQTMAIRIGCSQTLISAIERGVTSPSFNIMWSYLKQVHGKLILLPGSSLDDNQAPATDESGSLSSVK